MSDEYKIKSNPQTMPYPLGAYLKWESSPHTRQVIDAPAGTKMGEFVDYAPYGSKLLALSDEQNGKVVVQPQSCVIEYANISPAAIEKAGDFQAIVNVGAAHGIVYQNAPYTAQAASSS